MGEGRIIRTCKLLLASAAIAGLLTPSPALASRPLNSARTYLAARAAAITGDHSRSAELLAQLVEGSAANQTVARRAVSEAISAGEIGLALRLARKLPSTQLTIDSRLLLAADEIRSKRPARAVVYLEAASEEADLAFIAPMIEIWRLAERRDPRSLELLDQIPRGNPLAALANEHRALVLLKLRRTADAEPFARRAIAIAGPREHRLRLAFADGFLAAGDSARALAMLDGMGTEVGRARQRILSGKSSGLAVDTLTKAYSELLLALSAEVSRLNNRSLAIGLAQVARYAAPDNSAAAIQLGVLLDSRGRVEDALAVYRSVPASNGLAAQVRDFEVRTLINADREQEALQVAQRALASLGGDVSDYARMGDAYISLKRYNEAADAYGRALQLAQQGRAAERWPLLLLRASALEDADRWLDARQALGAALALAPNEPLILNFLGYAKLERGEDLDAAEAMIRKASELDPDNASITDSLGWALYKRGRLQEAIEILTRAAKGDPTQAEIHEHLGDALYKAGARVEARYSWHAALTTADDEIAARVRSKIESGLSSATAAP